jgi:hypothetical protein
MSITWRVEKSQLNKQFADDVDELLSNDPAEWTVTEGKRTSEYQQILYNRYLRGGPLAAPPGHSAHEAGLAIDVSLIKNKSTEWNYKDPDWRRLVNKVHIHPRLHSLDDYGDTDHIEAVNWRIIAKTVNV